MRQEPLSLGIYETLFLEHQGMLREPALRYFGRAVTYRGLHAQTERCAKAFLRWGVKPGDSVLLCSTMTPELVYALLALWKLGAVPHVLDPLSPPGEMAACMKESGARLCLVLDQLLPYLEEALQACALQLIVSPVIQSMPLLTRSTMGKTLPVKGCGSPREILWKDFLESGQVIGKTGATLIATGQDALVIYRMEQGGVKTRRRSHDTLYPNGMLGWGEGQERGDLLGMLAPWSETGIVDGVLTPLSRGMTLVLEPRYHSKAFVWTLKRERPLMAMAPLPFWRQVADRVSEGSLDVSFLRTAVLIEGREGRDQEELEGIQRLICLQNPLVEWQIKQQT